MLLKTDRIIIRDLERTDKDNLYRIIWQKNVVRFMGDWSEYNPSSESFNGYIDWHQSRKESKNIYENKRYAVVLANTDELIGVVGMGIEDTLNEVEMAYFIDEDYQSKGYATEALSILLEWCFEVSDISYLILTIDCANETSCKVATKAGFDFYGRGLNPPSLDGISF